MVDLRNAKEALENYLDGYERENDKVKLKIIHTYGVVECSRKIAEGLKLSEEDCKLAQIIGLLHDIGRFEQLKSYDSFEPETMNHAAYGVKILFEEGTIRRFVKEDKWDGIIKMAIARHSDYSLQGITDERELLHAQIIRDADKLDNCRVKLENPIETMLGVPEEAVGMSEISREVMQQFENQTSVLLETRRTKMDYWLSYLAYFFTSKTCFSPYWNNIMFTLALCLVTIWIIDILKDKISNKYLWYALSILIVAFFGFLSIELSLDYDYHAIVVAYLFYIFYDKPLLGAGLGYISIIKELYSFIGFGMTLTYNGERGKQYKWLNYFFYPVHILILGLLRIYLNI